MSISNSLCPQGQRARGLTLVELMVAMTVGLLILAAVSAVFVSSRRQYGDQDRLARIQENGRFALRFLVNDLRLAGYYGCFDEPELTGVSLSSAGVGTAFYPQAAIEGLDSATGPWMPSGGATLPASIVAGTDAVTVRMADPSTAVDLAASMASASVDIKVTSVTGFALGDVVMVSDCSSGDLMQVSAVQSGTTALSHGTGGAMTPGNAAAAISKAYSPPAQVARWRSRTWFVRQNANNVPALYRQDNNGTADEVVEGVEDLQLLYGIDTDATPDGAPNVFQSASAIAAADWPKVVAIKVWMLVRSSEQNQGDADASQPVGLDGASVAGLSSGYRRRVFTTTVQLRNMRS